MIRIQVTLISDKGYKPISCLVKVENKEYFNTHKKEIQVSGVQKICNKKLWDKSYLIQYGYTKSKMRIYKEV